ncbi:hypothetical protein AAIB41_11530 [Brucella sp. BE17]|uniref:hypothetical protein n=1 Tax=Brucella sp. BE17 TaxID=3142977 RepID=UPI0031BA60F1
MAPQSETAISRKAGAAIITLSSNDQGSIKVLGIASIGGQQALKFENILMPMGDVSWSDGDMTIALTGEIEMLKPTADHVVTAAGKVSDEAMILHLRNARVNWDGTDGDTELDLAFSFDLKAKGKPDNGRRASASNCQVVVWQPRPIANPFGSSMSTVMVPVCMPGR